MYHMNRRHETLGWRLTIYVNDSNVECTLGRIEHLPQAKALSQKEIKATSKDLEILKVNLLRRPLIQEVGKDVIKEEREISPLKIWGMMLSKALRQISRSPFTCRIVRAKLFHRFTQPTFTIYNGRTNPIEHVRHFNQRVVIHSRNKAFMCKVFPFSLEPIAMKWFDGLEEGSIRSYDELTRAFGVRFVTCSKISRHLDSLLSMPMREGETLKTYSDRY